MMLAVSGAAYMIGGGTMAPFKHIAGTAFACIGYIKFVFAAALATLIVQWPPPSFAIVYYDLATGRVENP